MTQSDTVPSQPDEESTAVLDDAQKHYTDKKPKTGAIAPLSADVLAEPVIAEGPSETSSQKKPASFLRFLPAPRLILESVLLVAFVALGLSVWSVSKDRDNLQAQLSTVNANPQQAVDRKTKSLIAAVGSIIQLPTNETPTVAEVSDAAQAKTQSNFFASAENGDKALLYVNAKQAILYRPSTNKVILQAPLTFSSQAATGSPATPVTTTTKR